jgi:hypothetical protein
MIATVTNQGKARWMIECGQEICWAVGQVS